ncbi:hypothetical protein BJV78DRAFT_1285282 [Lactifluus subvellereus]|nr:hypothetical protein BJV78DRAFT_1285282 [Lactifluus subvellereus]
MFQILLFLSTRISSLGDSMCRFTHGIFSLILFTGSSHSKSTLAPPPSRLLDASTTFPEPSSRLSNGLPVTHRWSELFLAQGFESYRHTFVVMGGKDVRIIGALMLLALLALLCVLSSSNLGNLFSILLLWAQSATARLSSSIHADCCTKISRMIIELAAKCSALDIALQQIKQGSARIQFLSAENCALNSLAVDQDTDIRTQSVHINQLEAQLHDQERAVWQALSYGEQHEWDARANRQEVARLEERIEILTAESNITRSTLLLNHHSAQALEGRLCDTLHANEMLLSEVQAALLELGTCAKQWEHWKVVAEQAVTRAPDADRTILNLRKELAVAFKNAREAKERFEDQTVVLGEREATIRSLDRELVDVRDQLRDAEDEIDRLQSDLEGTDIWKPLDGADGLRFVDESPPVLKWRGWLRENAPEMSAPSTQRRARSPDMTLKELESVGRCASMQAYPTPPNETLSCSTAPVVRFANLDDPFVVDTLTQPPFQLRNPTFAAQDVSTPSTTSRSPSPLCNTEIIDELREQVAHEQLARAHAENELVLQQMKLLATEAVVVVQRRQLSNQQCQLSTETAKSISLGEELRNLKIEHNTMAARVARLEASLDECQTARMATAKAANDARSESVQAREMLLMRTKEADAMKVERDAIDMRLSQAMLLSSALRERVMALEQEVTNVVSTPFDGAKDDCSLNLAVSPSMSHLLEICLPSMSSWGCISSRTPIESGLPTTVAATKSGPLSPEPEAPSRGWSTTPAKLSASLVPVSCEFDCLIASETTLSLLLASTPPDALPSMSPASASTSSSVRSDASSPHQLTHYPRPEDISPIPILGRVKKSRGSPPRVSGPYRPKSPFPYWVTTTLS